MYDIGYLLPLSPRQRKFQPTPPNYGRFVNSLRPDQAVDLIYNALIQPDPVEGFSWFVTGPNTGDEILAPYGDEFWDTPPSPVTTGKAFSSDNIPWYSRATSWIHHLEEGVDYCVGQDHIVVRRANVGVRVLQSDIDRIFEGTIGVLDLTLVPLLYHVHGHTGPLGGLVVRSQGDQRLPQSSQTLWYQQEPWREPVLCAYRWVH